jgi:hypothetical protein
MLSLITKIKLEQMAYEAMFTTDRQMPMVAVITMAFIHDHFSFAFAVLFSYLWFLSIMSIAYDVKHSYLHDLSILSSAYDVNLLYLHDLICIFIAYNVNHSYLLRLSYLSII